MKVYSCILDPTKSFEVKLVINIFAEAVLDLEANVCFGHLFTNSPP